ncbi:hypothetical protein QQF64_000149 [Cirrhinus molitorella]|uniref:Peptidase C2 calpain large subunit domain-containing protein n=1 Tax=Cirrhinus molitorella TaxID=172907 RepID=A0ABR3NWE2_9TELE
MIIGRGLLVFVVIGVEIQKNRRQLRKSGEDMHTIGYAIYEVELIRYQCASTVPGTKGCFICIRTIPEPTLRKLDSETFINLRGCRTRFKHPPERISNRPFTFETATRNGDFCLRVFLRGETV